MISDVLKETKTILYNFLSNNYSKSELKLILSEVNYILGDDICKYTGVSKIYNYEELQCILSTINEKGNKRKSNGVYYTPNDVVKFIYINAVKSLYGILQPNNLHVQDLNGIPHESFCFDKTIFDPTCGASEFLLVALSIKFDLLDLHQLVVGNEDVRKILSTIYGNDLDKDSVIISKIRILLFILNRYGANRIKDCSKIMEKNFFNIDFINLSGFKRKFDIIIGNPPYVEDSKCDTKPLKKFGNVYANVLDNVSNCLKQSGTMGFIVPLSYVSTPRMKKIRELINESIKEQYILSYCDRPDCLFNKVHQKLCIFIGKRKNEEDELIINTGNYQFWYKEEREMLFDNVLSVNNLFCESEFIPKLGTKLDCDIYEKVTKFNDNIYNVVCEEDTEHNVYLNMRAAFWIKAFLSSHTTGEYKKISFKNDDMRYYVYCLLNSSLFWWYWICVSDCWHITNKELKGFSCPMINDFTSVKRMAKSLEKKLEKTKKYIGTKQTDYEYKHKKCINEIHEIDDFICKSYNLTEEETIYIKRFAYKYRCSGGAKNENN